MTSEYNKKYYIDNKEAIKLKNKLYVENNKDSVYAYRYKWQKENIERYMLAKAKYRAKLVNLEFNIALEDVIIPKLCPVLKIKLRQSEITPSDNSPVIDRTDNTKGYIKGNINIISFRANRIKSDATFEEIELLYKYLKKKRRLQ